MVGMDIAKGQVMKMAGIMVELIATHTIMPKMKITEIKKAMAAVIIKASPTSLLAFSHRPRPANRPATADAR